MDERVKKQDETIKGMDTYADEASSYRKHRVEEISYEDSWNRKVKLSEMTKKLKAWNEVDEDSRYHKFFKGFVRLILELL